MAAITILTEYHSYRLLYMRTAKSLMLNDVLLDPGSEATIFPDEGLKDRVSFDPTDIVRFSLVLLERKLCLANK